MSALVDEAARIGDALAQAAIWHRDRCTWIAHHREAGPHGGPFAYALDPTIHTGTAGIALFLARLSRFTDDRTHRRVALGAMRHALRNARRDEPPGPRHAARCGGEWRLGFYLGGVGIAWAGVEVARALGERDREARALLDATLRAGPTTAWDVMAGHAGAIPALASLGRDEDALRLALDLAERKPGAWGFSHGAAGAAWALAAFPETREASAALFAMEDAARVGRADWPEVEGSPRRSWCHGAPGIGLARALAGRASGRATLRAARAATVAALSRAMPGDSCTPCCGALGLAECAWTMDDALGIPGGRARARKVAQWGLARYQAGDTWRAWPTGVSAGFHPSLLQGLAGVGHFLLRVEDPRRVPSVLVPGAMA